MSFECTTNRPEHYGEGLSPDETIIERTDRQRAERARRTSRWRVPKPEWAVFS